MSKETELKLGAYATDSISGFCGIVTARTVYLNGCVRVLLSPKGLTKDGVPIEGYWFDEQQVLKSSSAIAGGPQNDAPKY